MSKPLQDNNPSEEKSKDAAVLGKKLAWPLLTYYYDDQNEGDYITKWAIYLNEFHFLSGNKYVFNCSFDIIVFIL